MSHKQRVLNRGNFYVWTKAQKHKGVWPTMGAIKLYHMIGMGGEGENKNVSVCNR